MNPADEQLLKGMRDLLHGLQGVATRMETVMGLFLSMDVAPKAAQPKATKPKATKPKERVAEKSKAKVKRAGPLLKR